MKKFCSKCHIEKNNYEFYNEKANRDGLSRWCKTCSKECLKTYKIINKEQISAYNTNYLKQYYLKNYEEIKQASRKYYLENKNKIKEQKKIYRLKNKDKISKINKEYRLKNKDKIRNISLNYGRKKRKDPNYKLMANLRLRIYHAVKNNTKSDHTIKLIGCTLQELKDHLQQTAFNNGYLNFDINNYSGKAYHIDHIIPCSQFNLKCSYHQKLCFNYRNLQILARDKNLKKSDKFFEGL